MNAMRNVFLAVLAASVLAGCQTTQKRDCEIRIKPGTRYEQGQCCDRTPGSPCYTGGGGGGKERPNDPRPQ